MLPPRNAPWAVHRDTPLHDTCIFTHSYAEDLDSEVEKAERERHAEDGQKRREWMRMKESREVRLPSRAIGSVRAHGIVEGPSCFVDCATQHVALGDMGLNPLDGHDC